MGALGGDTSLTHPALHCTALHCTALHCTALHCTALHCTALHCTALHCTALHCTALLIRFINKIEVRTADQAMLTRLLAIQ